MKPKLTSAAIAIACLLLSPFLSPARSLRSEMQRMVILDNGREEPLDTFARRLFYQMSGSGTWAGRPAIDWLTRLLFEPEVASGDAVFLVQNRDVRIALDLTDPERLRYSFAELEKHLGQLHALVHSASVHDERGRSPLEKDLLQIYRNLSLYFQLASSLRALKDPQAKDLYRSSILAVIPPKPGEEAWLSPWEVVTDHVALPYARELLNSLSGAADAFGRNDLTQAAREVRSFNDHARRRTAASLEKKIGWELLYNRGNVFFIAMILYAVAFLLIMLFLLCRRRWLYRLSWVLAFIGLLPHSAGFVLRLLITGRPPVTNLYETFVFVAWTAAAIGVGLECSKKKNLGLIAGSFTGFIFLLISVPFARVEDTMGMMAAVLNTSLWLTLHVTTIALGYAGCVVAGVIGHIYLIQSLPSKHDEAGLDHAYRSLDAALIFGLVFTLLGTVMGGIWADLSWGRFWGWDPKENGALLIILWLAFLFHARRAGQIGRFGLAAGSIILIVIVVLTWFGVNQLGVGRHAYGFISGVSRLLIGFVALEIVFIGGAALRRRRGLNP